MLTVVFRRGTLSGESVKFDKEAFAKSLKKNDERACHPLDANLVTSEHLDQKHMVLLDLDVEHYYTSSSTPDHAHLYINKPLDWEDYLEVLQVLTKHGIVQEGYYERSKARGYAALRAPGITKDDYYANNPEENQPKEKNIS
jgi:hypothetical protein